MAAPPSRPSGPPPSSARPPAPPSTPRTPSAPAPTIRDLLQPPPTVVDRNRLPQPARDVSTPPGSVRPYPTDSGIRLDIEKGRTKGNVEIGPDKIGIEFDTPIKLPFDGSEKKKPKQ